jgi:hypothetical protein
MFRIVNYVLQFLLLVKIQLLRKKSNGPRECKNRSNGEERLIQLLTNVFNDIEYEIVY